MNKHVLISAAFIDGQCESDFITCCALKLKELGLHVSMHTTPDCSVIMAAQPQSADIAAKLPTTTDDVVGAPAPPANKPPAEVVPAVEVEVETSAGEVEIKLPAPAKFEALIFDLSSTTTIAAAPSEKSITELVAVGDHIVCENPQSVTARFTVNDTTYLFPLDKSGCFKATVSVNGKRKRVNIKPKFVESVAEVQLLLGRDDEELLIVRE